jgi:hypothetical protein
VNGGHTEFSLRPEHQKFFYFTSPGIDPSRDARACFECGLLWCKLTPDDLQKLLSKGNEECRIREVPKVTGTMFLVLFPVSLPLDTIPDQTVLSAF